MRLKGYVAVDNEPLYDMVILPSALTASDYLFFTIPLGQKDTNGSTAKTYVETNIDGNGGKLPDPRAFEIKGFALVPNFESNAADLAKIYNFSYFEIRVGGNSIVAHRCPTKTVTAGCGPSRTDSAQGVNGSPQPHAIQTLSETIIIDKGTSFSAALVVKETQTLSGGSAAVKMHCVLWGWHAKSVGKQS